MDRFDLARFVDAQAPVYDTALAELRAGEKRTHWIWFVFPQLAGLGHSAMADRYAIRSQDEARAYLAHAVLGPRLIESVETVLTVEGRSLDEIFGFPDRLKFVSSMTLFDATAPQRRQFAQALDKYCGGARDQRTLTLLGDTG